jgi:hypothetical protein
VYYSNPKKFGAGSALICKKEKIGENNYITYITEDTSLA